VCESILALNFQRQAIYRRNSPIETRRGNTRAAPNRMPENTQGNTLKNKRRTDHLEATKWKPGQSGNPGGRPKKQPITERYAILAETPLDDKFRRRLKLPEGSTYADAAALEPVTADLRVAGPHWED
jgi:hypothetical protein